MPTQKALFGQLVQGVARSAHCAMRCHLSYHSAQRVLYRFSLVQHRECQTIIGSNTHLELCLAIRILNDPTDLEASHLSGYDSVLNVDGCSGGADLLHKTKVKRVRRHARRKRTWPEQTQRTSLTQPDGDVYIPMSSAPHKDFTSRVGNDPQGSNLGPNRPRHHRAEQGRWLTISDVEEHPSIMGPVGYCSTKGHRHNRYANEMLSSMFGNESS
jgi:hypothetical protein